MNTYVSEAFRLKKFAFVSDYVRVYALYHYGGIYLDTDVEVFKPFDDLLDHDSFWGFEQGNYIATSTIGSRRGNQLIKEFLDSYNEKKFVSDNGSKNDLTNVSVITKMVEGKGLIRNGKYQEIKGLGAFYPQVYFSPYDYINCRKLVTEDTYTMHYFYKSWLPFNVKIKSNFKMLVAKLIGGRNILKLRKILSRNRI